MTVLRERVGMTFALASDEVKQAQINPQVRRSAAKATYRSDIGLGDLFWGGVGLLVAAYAAGQGKNSLSTGILDANGVPMQRETEYRVSSPDTMTEIEHMRQTGIIYTRQGYLNEIAY